MPIIISQTNRDEYINNGYTILTEQELPISQEDWQVIEAEHASLDYKPGVKAATGEEVRNVKYFRIKVSFLPEIHNQKIWSILNSQKMYDIYKTIGYISNPHMDCCQAHIYGQNGLLGKHRDRDTAGSYECAGIMMLNDDYDGNEFVIFNNEINPATLKPPARSLVLTATDIPHQVNIVKDGDRRNICFFLSDGLCPPEEPKICG